MADAISDYLIRQFETAWKLTSFHLEGLTTRECLWRPASRGLKGEWQDVLERATANDLRSTERTH